MRYFAQAWLLSMLYVSISSLEHQELQPTPRSTNKIPCPKLCVCYSNRRVECVNKSLKAVPNDIPITTVYLDISQNKNIHIPETYFTELFNLKHLAVKSCELENHFILPRRLMSIMIQNNKLSFEEFRLMFSNSSPFLWSIDAASNNIDINSSVSLFENSASLRELSLSNNIMPIIYKETFRGLHKLEVLDVSHMSLKYVQDGAFKDLVNMWKLNINNNEMRSLPENLFRPLGGLEWLDLSGCHLVQIPNLKGLPSQMAFLSFSGNHIKDITSMAEMGVTSIRRLHLQQNRISKIPATVFQTIAVQEIDCSNNKVLEIESNSFTACRGFLTYLILYSNQIRFISSNAFKNLTHIDAIVLSGNNINKIHPETFKYLSFKILLLDKNNISQLPAFRDGTISQPSKILLFNNPMTEISNVMVQGLLIYLDCDKLQQVSGPIERNSSLWCVPSLDFVLEVPDDRVWKDFAMKNGYSCTSTASPTPTMTCKTCSPGYFLKPGKSCIECPPGSLYQDQLAQLQCKQCTPGQYVPPEKAPGKSSLDCITCPEGTRTNESAGFRACRCLDGFSRTDRFGTCTKCITKGVQCKDDYQNLKPNFWWSWEYNRTCLIKYLDFVENLKTKTNSYNRHSSAFYCSVPKAHHCLSKGVCLGGVHSKCQTGYIGPLCALCQQGYYKHFKSCVRCPHLWIACLQFAVYLLLFVFLCALVNWADKHIVKLVNDEERSLADMILSTLKIFLGFYQVLNGTLTSFSYVPWPETLKVALAAFKYIEFEIFRLPSLRCINNNWKMNAIGDFWFSIIGTVFVPCAIFIYYVIKKCILLKHCRTRQEFLAKSNSCKQNCLRSTVIFLFSIYPIISKRILQLLPFSCDKICYDNASKHCPSFIKIDYSLKCLASSAKTWLLYVVYTCILIPIGFPMFLLFSLLLLFRVRKHKEFYTMMNADEYKESRDDQQALLQEVEEIRYTTNHAVDSNGTTRFALKFLYENYKAFYWYWEVIEMYRKLLLTSVLPVITSQSRIFLGLAIVLSSFFTVLHAYTKPIKDSFENYLQLISLSVIPANLCIGYILETMVNQGGGVTARTEDKFGISVLLLVLNSLLIFVLLVRLVKVQIKKCNILLTEGKCSCRCCVACILPCIRG